MRVIQNIAEWQAVRASLRADEREIGFVPTLGALHAGHRSLLVRCRRENRVAVLSIFVNPTQFNDPKDLAAYPRTIEGDLKMAGDHVDYVLIPTAAEMYSDNFRFQVGERPFSETLEGKYRPGHFAGMLTVVLKLLNLVQPARAYFGEKDWQQLKLVRELAAAFFLPVEIVGCPTVREPSGLAFSSRNERLRPAERERAAQFPRILRSAPCAASAVGGLRAAGFDVDYVEDHEGVRLGAIRVAGVRLIDNVAL